MSTAHGPGARELAPIDRALIALGAVVLGFTLQISDGFYRPRAYPSFCLAIACAAGGLLRAGSSLIGAGPSWSTVAVLAAGLFGNFVMLGMARPAYYLKERWPSQHPGYVAGIIAAAILTLLIGIDERRRRQIWFPALLGLFACGYAARDRVASLAAALVLFTPRTFFVLEQGWTEAFVICWLGATVAAAAMRSSNRALMLGLLCAVKQHMVVALAFGAWLTDRPDDPSQRNRLVLRALGVATALTLRFFIWDPAGFWRSVVWLQFQEPMRADSLSMLSLIVHAGWSVPRVVQTLAPLIALTIGLAISFRCAPRTPAGFALAIGVSFLLMFAFSKKAFCNYYFFVLAALAAGVAVSGEDGTRAEPSETIRSNAADRESRRSLRA